MISFQSVITVLLRLFTFFPNPLHKESG
jgi:hypothetical protein